MKKVLIYFRRWTSIVGGGELLPLMFISELQKMGCDVTLALEWQSEVEQVSQTIGIPIDFSNLSVDYVKPKNKILCKIDMIFPIFRTNRLKKLAKNADICISALNTCDFGRPAHHFIWGVSIDDNMFLHYARHEQLSTTRVLVQHINRFLMQYILRPLFGVRSPQSIIGNPREHIYPNSLYIENLLRSYYGPFTSTLFYPPTTFESVLQDRVVRDPRKVVYIGRIHPEKRLEDIIDIVEKAREKSKSDIILEIVGVLKKETAYGKRMQAIAAEKQWIHFLGPLYGEEKDRFLCSGTYALHAERDEAFGISITEYLKAGCIPIVPDEGGTPEVVDNPALAYHTNEDAARILTHLLTDDVFRLEQLNHCKKRAKAFSFERYMENQHIILDRILKEPL